MPDSKETTESTKTVKNTADTDPATDSMTNKIANIATGNSTQKAQKLTTDAATAKNSGVENEGAATTRKESLFAKHMKKTKNDTTPPLPKYVVLAVIDEGNGIPEGKREEVFSPFVRLQQKNKGSGLGLSLVSQIATAHQGRIITDTLNGHTRFLVTIPVKHDPHFNHHE